MKLESSILQLTPRGAEADDQLMRFAVMRLLTKNAEGWTYQHHGIGWARLQDPLE